MASSQSKKVAQSGSEQEPVAAVEAAAEAQPVVEAAPVEEAAAAVQAEAAPAPEAVEAQPVVERRAASGARGSAAPEVVGARAEEPAVAEAAPVAPVAPVAMQLPSDAPWPLHEDLALLRRVVSEVSQLEQTLAQRLEQRGPLGRRLARVRTVLEDAWLQARQGEVELLHEQQVGAAAAPAAPAAVVSVRE